MQTAELAQPIAPVADVHVALTRFNTYSVDVADIDIAQSGLRGLKALVAQREDLLAALRAIRDEADHDDATPADMRIYDRACQAIDKAEGR